MNEFTKEDWVEIYYALDSKAARVRDGEYSADKNLSKKWSAHLREIMEKIGQNITEN